MGEENLEDQDDAEDAVELDHTIEDELLREAVGEAGAGGHVGRGTCHYVVPQ